MKKLFLLYLLLLASTLTTIAQNRWVISPNTGFDADFPSIAAACASSQVQEGDLLMVHGGYYGNDTISKAVGVVGTGYFLGDNGATDIQANSISALFGGLIIQATADNSYIIGIEASSISIQATDISISKCRVINTIYMYSNCEAITIEQSYITRGIYRDSSNKSVVLKNNYIGKYNTVSIYSPNGNSQLFGVIRNNVIAGYMINYINSVQFQNNIFTQLGTISLASGGTFTNNIFVGTVSNTGGSGNQYEVDATTLFVGATNNSTDGQWQLAEDSPATGAGIGGTDCGMFGGDTPYVLSGLPGIPNIYSLTTPNTGNNGGMNVEVKVKTNN